MRWFSIGLLAFLCLVLAGVGAASLVSTQRSALEYFQIKPQEPLQAEADNSDLQFQDFERIANVPYGPHGVRNHLDIYRPLKRDSSIPVIVISHGGLGWKGETPESFAVPLLERGYAVVQINYRHVTGFGNLPKDECGEFPAQIQDAKAAIRFVRANAEKYGFDADRIGAMGHSMGGYISAMLCTTSDLDIFNDDGENREHSSAVQAACSSNGPTDWRTMLHERYYLAEHLSLEYHFDELADQKDSSPGDFGSYLTKGSIRVAEQASPITYASSGDPPILLITGFQDLVVPPHQHHALFVRLRNVGGDAQIRIIPGAGHFGPAMMNRETRTMAADFFDQHLLSTSAP